MVLYFSVKINLVSYRIPTNLPKKNKVSTNNRFQPAWNPNVKIIQNLFNPSFLRKRGRDQFGSYPTWAFPWIISTIYRLNKWCIIESNENHYSSSAPARLEVGRSLLIPATAPHLSFRIAFFFLCRGDRYCLIQSMIPFPCRKLPPMSKVPIRYPITNANCIYAPIILLPTSPYFSNTFLSSFIRNTEHLTEISWRTRRKKQETRSKRKKKSKEKMEILWGPHHQLLLKTTLFEICQFINSTKSTRDDHSFSSPSSKMHGGLGSQKHRFYISSGEIKVFTILCCAKEHISNTASPYFTINHWVLLLKLTLSSLLLRFQSN